MKKFVNEPLRLERVRRRRLARSRKAIAWPMSAASQANERPYFRRARAGKKPPAPASTRPRLFPVQFRVDYTTLLKLALAADRHGGVPKDEIAAEVLIQALDTRSVDEFIPTGE